MLQDAIGVLKKLATSSQQAERYHGILKNLHADVHRRQEQILRRNRQLSDRPVSKIMCFDSVPVENRDDEYWLTEELQIHEPPVQPPPPPPGLCKTQVSQGWRRGRNSMTRPHFLVGMVPHLTTGRHWSRFLRLATSIKSKFDCKFKWVSILTEAFFGIEYSQSRICTVRWRDSRNDMCYPQRIPGPISLLSDYWQDLPHDSLIFFARKFYGLGNCT